MFEFPSKVAEIDFKQVLRKRNTMKDRNTAAARFSIGKGILFSLCILVCLHISTAIGFCEETAAPDAKANPIGMRELFDAGGIIGVIILALSCAMVALIFEHLFSIRRSTLMPPGLPEEVHSLIAQQQFQLADQTCKQRTSFLGRVLSAGLQDVSLGYTAVEKSMEDTAREQSARLLRKIEYLQVIGTIAPMLGLLGTVWGMITAFMEFETQANPQVSQLAPGIYRALVTTFLGLSVAVPALASFALFRNRIDELVAESSIMAEYIFADYKRSQLGAVRKSDRQRKASSNPQSRADRPSIPPVAIERRKD